MRKLGYSPAPISPAYSPQFYGTPQLQPASWQSSIGDFFGNLGNSWQGGEDAPMYGGNAQSVPYATAQGAVNYGTAAGGAAVAAGQAVAQGAKNLVAPVGGFVVGLARGGGAILGIAIIAGVLLAEGGKHRA